MRADVVQSLFGELVIYKSQSKIHIEFSRQSAPKMRILEQLYFEGKIRDVVDGLCGPGTLGLMCALAGAKRVVLNDAWLPAVQNVQLNLKVNQKTSRIGGDRVSRETRCNCGKGSGACRPRTWTMPDRGLPWRPDKALYESTACRTLPYRSFSRSKYSRTGKGLQMLQRDSNSINKIMGQRGFEPRSKSPKPSRIDQATPLSQKTVHSSGKRSLKAFCYTFLGYGHESIVIDLLHEIRRRQPADGSEQPELNEPDEDCRGYGTMHGQTDGGKKSAHDYVHQSDSTRQEYGQHLQKDHDGINGKYSSQAVWKRPWTGRR